MHPRFKILLFCIIAFACIGCDRATKDMAKADLMYHVPISYLHGFFVLEYAENTGAALSLGADLPQPYNRLLLGIVPLLVMIALGGYALYHARRMPVLQLISLALIFAGGMGNVADRLLADRHVIDFMNMGIGQLRTGIFNVADVCISAGVIGLFISLQGKKAVAAAN